MDEQLSKVEKRKNHLLGAKAIFHEMAHITAMLLILFMALYSLDGWRTALRDEHMSLLPGLTKVMPGLILTSFVISAMSAFLEYMLNRFSIKRALEYFVFDPVLLFIAMGYLFVATDNKVLMSIGVISVTAIFVLFIATGIIHVCVFAIDNHAEIKGFWMWLFGLIKKRRKQS